MIMCYFVCVYLIEHLHKKTKKRMSVVALEEGNRERTCSFCILYYIHVNYFPKT